MSSGVRAALCGLLFVMAAGQAHAQAGKPGAAIPSVSVPPGAGMPDGKPIDIRGLHTGMSSDAALAVLRDHYKSQAVKLNVVSATLPNTNTPFVAFGTNDRRVDGNSYDLLGAAFTSNANGNQVVSIISNVRYAPGQERNTAETIAAIKQKYGEPSETNESRHGVRFQYTYKSGRLLNGKTTCESLGGLWQVTLTAASVGTWRQAMYGATGSDVSPQALGPDKRDCAGVMFIYLGYGRLRDDYNPKALAEMNVFFYDAARFKAAADRDATVVKELEEKARSGAPAGSGASKL